MEAHFDAGAHGIPVHLHVSIGSLNRFEKLVNPAFEPVGHPAFDSQNQETNRASFFRNLDRLSRSRSGMISILASPRRNSMKIPRQTITADIPTSSMADIAFLLIVFFMLTSVFASNKGITHLLPADKSGVAPEAAIFIHILSNGNIVSNGNTWLPDQMPRLADHVAMILQQNPSKPIILLSDSDAAYGRTIAVLDQLKQIERALEIQLSITIPSGSEAEFYRNLNPT